MDKKIREDDPCECGCKKILKEEHGDCWFCKNCKKIRYWI